MRKETAHKDTPYEGEAYDFLFLFLQCGHPVSSFFISFRSHPSRRTHTSLHPAHSCICIPPSPTSTNIHHEPRIVSLVTTISIPSSLCPRTPLFRPCQGLAVNSPTTHLTIERAWTKTSHAHCLAIVCSLVHTSSPCFLA